MENVLADMRTKELNAFAEEAFGISVADNPPEKLPDSEEELGLHMQLSYKQAVELAEEQAINTLLEGNRYELTRKRVNYDLTVLGIACVKNGYNKSEGVTVDYVDPANIVYSHADSPYFDDIYYVGEVKNVTINELKKQFPNITNEELKEISQQAIHRTHVSNRSVYEGNDLDNNLIQVLYFNYKTYGNEVYKVKTSATGASKILVKDDSFDPPEMYLMLILKKLTGL